MAKDGKRKAFTVHRLVANAFLKNPNGYPIINHKDENKMNWNIDNLELLTRSEHIKKHSDIVHRKGIKIIAIKDGKELTFSSIKDAAAGCGTYPVLVARVLNGTQKQSKGWIFRKVG